MKMDLYTAVSIAEGFDDGSTNQESREAWQYLVDTGAAWTLQGWFGRTARDLIAAGEIMPPPEKEFVPPA